MLSEHTLKDGDLRSGTRAGSGDPRPTNAAESSRSERSPGVAQLFAPTVIAMALDELAGSGQRDPVGKQAGSVEQDVGLMEDRKIGT